jgi:hypothetical protein
MAVQVTFGVPNRVHEKVWEVPFSGPDGKSAPYPLKYWDSSPFRDSIKEGLTAPVEVEKKPARNNPNIEEHWIKALDGVGEKPKGGPGRPAAPKTPLEIHCSCIAGIIKSCLDNAVTDTKQINELFKEVYWPQVERAK